LYQQPTVYPIATAISACISLVVFQNGSRNVTPNLHVIDVDCFGNPILAIEDYTLSELTQNKNKAMVTVVFPFTRA